jgi:hypothetical protein
MAKNQRAAEEKVTALQQELENLRDELDSNLLDQEELRGIARGLEERIEVIENQLDENCLAVDDE